MTSARPAATATTGGPRLAGALPSILTTSVLFVAALYFLLPLVWLVFAATKSPSGLVGSFGLWFADENTFGQNIVAALQYQNGLLPRWLLNSVLYSTVAAVVSALLSTMAGFALAKYEFRGRGLVLGLIVAGVLVPGAMLTVPLFLMFAGVGLVNTVWAVLLPSMISPFGVYLGWVFAAEAIPTSLIEASRLDGASDFRFFFTIGLRLMGPAVVTMFLFQFVGTWNNFMLPLMMLVDIDLQPVTVGLWQVNTLVKTYPEYRPVLLAGTLLSVVPLILAFCFLQRFWRSGMAAGAIKD